MKKFLMLFSCLILFGLGSCTDVSDKAARDKEALRVSNLPVVTVWVFDSLKCPFFTVAETDSVKNLVEWYSFAPTTKRVFAINTHTFNERVFPQGDVFNYEKSFEAFTNKVVKDVRLRYVSPYQLDSILSPVTVKQCMWWYRKSGRVILGYAYVNDIWTVVSHIIGSNEYSQAYLRPDGWKISVEHPYVGGTESQHRYGKTGYGFGEKIKR